MTKRTLNAHELEIIAGGAVDLAESAPAITKVIVDPPVDPGSPSNSAGGSIDNDQVQQNQDLPGA